jgi:primosomal protein N' (replication factor Y)
VIERKPSEILTEELLRILPSFRNRRVLFLVPKQGYSYAFCVRCETLVQCQRCGNLMTYSRVRGILYCTACGFKGEELLCGECEGELEEAGFGIEKVFSAIEETGLLQEGFLFSTYPSWGEKFDVTVVVSADNLLSIPTYRAKEEVFIYLLRATVSSREETLIQTIFPQERVFGLLKKGEERDFYLRELEEREREKLPPFWRLALVKTTRRDLGAYMAKVVSPYLQVAYSPREGCYRILIRFRDRGALRRIGQLLRRFGRDIIEVRVDPF